MAGPGVGARIRSSRVEAGWATGWKAPALPVWFTKTGTDSGLRGADMPMHGMPELGP
jgi:hypothetical protein